MPIGLGGGAGAGGLNETLFALTRQAMLQQELDQRRAEQEYQRQRAERLDAASADETKYQRGRDDEQAARATRTEGRQTEQDQIALAKAQLDAMQGQKFDDIVDPATRGLDAPPALGLPPLPGTLVGGRDPLAVRQGKPKAVSIGGISVRPKTAEDLRQLADEESARAIKEREAGMAPSKPAPYQHVEGGVFDPNTGTYKKAEGWTPPKAGGGPLSLSDQLSATLRLRADWRRETSAAQTAVKQYQLMESALQSVREGRAAPGSQGVLVTFQKILDPLSVVRESEYARSAAGLALLSQLEGKWERIKSGGAEVPLADLEDFLATAKGFAQKQADYTKLTKSQIDRMAKKFGLDPEDITRDLDEDLNPTPPAGGKGGATPPAGGATPPAGVIDAAAFMANRKKGG